MAKLLFKKGNFRILSDDVGKLSVRETNSLTKIVGTVSHQARERSKKTPEEFTEMLQDMGHWAALEHNWFTFLILPDSYLKFVPEYRIEILDSRIRRANNLFCTTQRTDGLLVSGNARMWSEAYINDEYPQSPIIGSILSELSRENPILFPSPKTGFKTEPKIQLIKNPELLNKKEILAHRAMAVEFNSVSRGFTHEDVRSRNGVNKIASYLQESTRYVDYAKRDVDLEKFGMKFIPNYTGPDTFNTILEVRVKDNEIYHWSPGVMVDVEEAIYRTLRKNGWKPEEARQWLPIGLKAQVVQTYNLNEWRHWFYIRTGKGAHSEIRYVAVNLLKEVQKRIPNVFDDFEFRFRKDGTEYARYIGDDELI